MEEVFFQEHLNHGKNKGISLSYFFASFWWKIFICEFSHWDLVGVLSFNVIKDHAQSLATYEERNRVNIPALNSLVQLCSGCWWLSHLTEYMQHWPPSWIVRLLIHAWPWALTRLCTFIPANKDPGPVILDLEEDLPAIAPWKWTTLTAGEPSYELGLK